MMTATPTKHVFELAGLGAAPFRVVGFAELKFQAHPGAPVKAGGSCDYCNAAIMNAFRIKSADGRTFKVGSDCVFKTGDSGLRRQVSELEAEARRAKQRVKTNAVRELVADPVVREKLAAKPHPFAALAQAGKTMLDWAEWMMENAGASGKLRVGKAIALLN